MVNDSMMRYSRGFDKPCHTYLGVREIPCEFTLLEFLAVHEVNIDRRFALRRTKLRLRMFDNL